MFPKIFHGVRVLDFSRLLPGPFASDLLVRLGADVTCVVPPGKDPLLGNYSPFEKIKAGKKFLTLDLKSAEGKQQVREEAAKRSILLEGFRPGTMSRLGFGFDDVRKFNPEILYVSIIGYPEGHVKFLKGAHDINFLVDSGLYSLIHPDNGDTIPALQLADVVGGFYAAFQILAAWIQRISEPRARHLKVSVLEGLELLAEYLKHESSLALLPLLTGGLARYRIYFTKDKKRIAVAALEPKFFVNLCKALNIDLAGDEGEAEIAGEIQKQIGSKDFAELKDVFRDVDACVSFIPSREEVLKGTFKPEV